MDTKTLSVSISIVGIAVSLMSVLFAAFRRERGLTIYAAGFMSGALGFMLFLGQGSLSRWLAFVLANMLIVFHHFCLAWGLRSYFRIGRGWPLRFWFYLLLWFVSMVAGTFVYDSYIARASLSSAFILLASAEYMLAFSQIKTELPPVVRRAGLMILYAFIFFHVLRIVFLFLTFGSQMFLLQNSMVSAYTFLFSLFFTVLWAGLVLIIDTAHLVQQLEKKNATLESMATIDELTGLRNRHTLDARLKEEVERAARYHIPLSAIMLDIDHFKRINDTWGHQAGDVVLRRLADLTRAHVRQPDDLFRWGGEEFLVLAPHTGLEGAINLAEKLRLAVAAELFQDIGRVTASFGVAEWRIGEASETWLRRVDQALYRAKNTGRDRVIGFGAEGSMPLARVHIGWNAEWESGNSSLDVEHRELVDLSNKLLDVSLSGGTPSRLLEAIDALIGHVARHFTNEEQILAACGYPELEAHAKLHKRLEREAVTLRSEVESGKSDVRILFDFLVNHVIFEHIARDDSRFFGYTRQCQGAGDSISVSL